MRQKKLTGVRPKDDKIEVNYTPKGGQRIWFTLDKRPTQRNLEWASRNRLELVQQHLDGNSEQFEYYAVKSIQNSDLELSTQMDYASLLDQYWSPLNLRKATEINFRDLSAIDENTPWTSKKRRANAIGALRFVMKYVYKQHNLPINENPALGLEIGKKTRKLPDPFTHDQREQIMDWMVSKGEAGQYFRTAFGTGMRSGELIALREPHFRGDHLLITETRVRGQEKETTKTDEERKVWLPGWLIEELEVHIATHSNLEEDHLFLNQYQRHYQKPDSLNKVFRACLMELGIRWRAPYPWRHTYASIGLTEGIKPAFLAQQLGHDLKTFYSIYATWISRDSDREEMAKIENTYRSSGAEVVEDGVPPHVH